ncbi:solute carrier family 23 protein [Desulfococcus sp.]|uniref:solute carrier family 23 protein n=1 Tax=Desulfococcus sp. TaxID=2025834 RepID=UPI003D0EAC06
MMVIGLVLAPVAVNMAMGKTGDGAAVLVPERTALFISMLSLAVTVLVSLKGRGMLRLIPILCGITAGYLVSLLQTIPTPVMGGIMLLLFGAIMVVGLNSLVKAGEDLMEPRNMCIVSLVLVFGIGGMVFSAGDFSIKGIGLSGILGVLLNLVLPRSRRPAA